MLFSQQTKKFADVIIPRGADNTGKLLTRIFLSSLLACLHALNFLLCTHKHASIYIKKTLLLRQYSYFPFTGMHQSWTHHGFFCLLLPASENVWGAGRWWNQQYQIQKNVLNLLFIRMSNASCLD